MHNIFEKSEIKFHTAENKFEDTILSGFPNDILHKSKHFGTLQFKMVSKSEAKIPQTFAILFNVDCSASMDDVSRDGRTKMQHVIHTLNRILSIFAEMNQLYNAAIFVSVVAFDNKIHKIFDFTKITQENLEHVKEMVKRIEPLENTNIELALKEALCICHDYKKANPYHYLHHVLLTDGDANDGETRPDTLSNFVNKNYPNVFIGFGKEHNSRMLTRLSNNIRGDYRFIDNIEYAGLVYGEIIQNILYNIVDVGRIVVKNGLIYDWKSNQWTNELPIANLAGSCEKTYQITAPDMYDIEIEIYGCVCDFRSPHEHLLETVVYYPPLFDLSEDTIRSRAVDLTPYAFRQKTQELLYEANILSANDDSHDYKHYESETVLKCKLKRFLKFMMDYMERANKKSDKFMKLLCDDIYVTFRSLGNRESSMWIHNRQSSQGKQQTYKATPSRVEMLSPPLLRRQTNHWCLPQTPVPTTGSGGNFEGGLGEELHDTEVQTTNLFANTQELMASYMNTVDYYDLSQNTAITLPLPFPPFTDHGGDVVGDSIGDNDIESEVSNESVDSIVNYELSNSIDTPYITDEIIYMMKTIGGDKIPGGQYVSLQKDN